jgi:hypothetical protein
VTPRDTRPPCSYVSWLPSRYSCSSRGRVHKVEGSVPASHSHHDKHANTVVHTSGQRVGGAQQRLRHAGCFTVCGDDTSARVCW